MKIRLGLDLIYLTQKLCIPVQVFGLRLPFLVKNRSRINPTDHLVFPFSCFPVVWFQINFPGEDKVSD